MADGQVYFKRNGDVVAVSSDDPMPVASGFDIGAYDAITLGYDGDGNLTSVVYSLLGEPLATLTLSYTDGKLTGIVRS